MAEAVAIGTFIGCLPLYGLHLVLCLAACVPRRLDSVLAYLAANISNPLIAPFLLTLEVEVGSLLLTGEHTAFTLEHARATGVSGYAKQAALGGVLVGAVLAALGAAVAFVVARRLGGRAESALSAAIARTLARYRSAPIGDRMYVAGKLEHDPVLAEIAALPGDFGRVLDAGAGRGQLGLCLLELGRVESLFGFDSDGRKIALARAAAGADAEFAVADLGARFAPADTVLLIDVLHYLPRAEQDAVLAEAVSAVPSGGRVLVRELDGVPGWRSAVTRLFERLATALGVNRGRARLEYRSAAELRERLTALGCECEIRGASEGTPFANVLIVARRL